MLLKFQSSAKANYGWWLVGIGVVVMTLTGNGLVLSFVRISGTHALGRIGSAAAFVRSRLQAKSAWCCCQSLAWPWIVLGPRPMMLAGLTLCAVAAVAASLLPVGVATLALFPVLTAGTLVGTSTPVLTSINHWFYRRRALAIAVLLFAVDALKFPISLATTDLGTADPYFRRAHPGDWTAVGNAGPPAGPRSRPGSRG